MLNGWCTPRTLKRLRSQLDLEKLSLHDDDVPPRSPKRTQEELPSFPLLLLPPEILFQIISHLDPAGYFNISRSCLYLSQLCSDNTNMLWKTYSEKKFQFASDRKDVNWNSYYRERTALLKDGSFNWKAMDFKIRPSPRMCHSGVADGQNIYYIGGQSGQTTRFDDVFQFDGKQFTALNTTIASKSQAAPPKFARHTTICINNKLYTFGGFDGLGQYFSLAIFDPVTTTWTYPVINGPSPVLRTNHAASAIGSKLYIYGGNRTESDEYMILDDFWVLDTETLTWSQPKTYGEIPGPRVAHKLISMGTKLYLFGGGIWTPKKDWVMKTNKMHVFDTETMVWTTVKATGEESIRASSFAIPFQFSHWIFIYGGQSIVDGIEVDDLVSFDTVTNSWHKHTVNSGKHNPGPRSVGTANYSKGAFWLFGGSGTHALENSVHRLSHPLFTKSIFPLRPNC